MTRRTFAAATAGTLRGFAAERPNVLVFMTDQESALLPGPARLPSRKRLLDRGINYTHAFCNTPQCSPARASLLAGLEPHAAGVLTNVDGGSLGKGLRPETPTIGSVFANAGYETGYFGKWHLGQSRGGFAKFETGEGDADTVRAASDWLRARRQPWLCWVSVLDPHHIYDIPRAANVTPSIRPGVRPPHSGLENLRGKPSEQRAFVDQDQGRLTREFSTEDWLRYRSFYLDLVEKTDSYLGTMLDAAGSLDNTVAAYTTDHGDQLGEHGLPYKGPFMYDELLRIPLIVAGRRIASGTLDGFVRQSDLASILSGAAGLAWPGRAHRPDHDAVFLEYYSKQKWVNPIRTIRTRNWKYNHYDHSGHEELYAIDRDPHELQNLANAEPHAGMKAGLRQRLDNWWKR